MAAKRMTIGFSSCKNRSETKNAHSWSSVGQNGAKVLRPGQQKRTSISESHLLVAFLERRQRCDDDAGVAERLQGQQNRRAVAFGGGVARGAEAFLDLDDGSDDLRSVLATAPLATERVDHTGDGQQAFGTDLLFGQNHLLAVLLADAQKFR